MLFAVIRFYIFYRIFMREKLKRRLLRYKSFWADASRIFQLINLSVIPSFIRNGGEMYQRDIKGLVRIWRKGGGDRPLTGSIKTRLVVRGARCILRRTPRRHRQCVVQWHLIRNNGPSSHILMVHGPYVLDGEHYIALEDPALVLESRIRIQPRSNVWISTYAQAFTHCTLRMCVCVCVACMWVVGSAASRTRAPLQMRLNFVDDKSRP